MIDRVVEARQQPERRQVREAVGLENHSGPDSHEDDPDVFNAVVGQKTFQVMFHQRVHHAQQCRDSADRQDDETPPPRKGPAQEIEINAHQSVDRGFDHDAGHQGRDM